MRRYTLVGPSADARIRSAHPPPRSLLIVEGDPLISEFLAELAAPGLPGTVIRTCASLEEGLGILGEDLDLLVLGPGLAGGPALAALECLRLAANGPAIILVTEHRDEALALRALGLGAQDCLARADLDAEGLGRALRFAHARGNPGTGPAPAAHQGRAAEHLLACTVDAMRASIAIVDEDGLILAANAAWNAQDPSRNPLVPPWSLGTTNFAAFCRTLAVDERSISSIARGFLAVQSGTESRFVGDVQWGEGLDLQAYGATFQSFETGGRRCVGVAIADISPRVRTERRLRENEEMFRIISEKAGDLVALVDRNGRPLYRNAAHARTLGFTMEELADILPLDLLHPEDRSRVQRELLGLYLSEEDGTTEFRMRHKDGTWRHFEGRAAIVRGGSTAPDLAIIVSRDITERIRADMELLKAHAIKNLILENSTLGIAFVRRRVFEWANARVGEIVGRPMAAILGAPTRALYPDEASYEEMGRRTYPGMQRGERTDVTWQLVRGDGTLFWCRMIGKPLDPLRPDEGSVWLMEDITEQKSAEQERLSLEVQLRHAQKLEAIGQLAAGIAHEINTPTQYIGDNTKFLAEAFHDVFRVLEAQDEALAAAAPGTVDRVRDETDLPYLKEEIPRAIEQSLEGIARVTTIVKAMKDFSHPGSEDPVDVDLNRSIESTITVSRNEWKYVADLVLNLDPTLPRVLCYPNEINQAILNLVVNAAHAIAEAQGEDPGAKGTITVTTSQAGGMAEIRVRDSGTGIPEAVRPRIFDPFFTTKVVGRGTGQGLAIVHTVVVGRHNGSVDFETELGKGSEFILRIPIAGSRERSSGG